MNKVAGMAHILLPKSQLGASLKFPHKYADSSVESLVKNLIKHGAEKRGIKAAIVGGANLFVNPDCMIGDENIISVKEALLNSEIKIIKEHLGGNLGRVIQFDPNDYSIRVKSTGENKYVQI